MEEVVYSDSELEAATALSMIHVRRLITWSAVRPVRGGKGVVRQWERSSIRHIARVATLYNAGLSLPLSHTMAILTPAAFMFNMIDPDAQINPGAKFKFFSPNKPLPVLDTADVVLTIIDGYSIYFRLGKSKAFFIGRLSSDRSVFLSALDYTRWTSSGLTGCNPRSLSWKYAPELASNRAQEDAAQHFQRPVSATIINLSLACKIAMRRLLGISITFSKGAHRS